MTSARKIVYIYDENLRKQCDKLPKMRFRSTMVQELINCYGILRTSDAEVQESRTANYEELVQFHSSDYINFIKNVQQDITLQSDQDMYGLSYDCPVLEGLYDFIAIIAGASLKAAEVLCRNDARVAINWFGGWHHAQRDEAEGFCYVNDIVLAIQQLNAVFERVLYVDLDVHHGNGVQNAFEYSNKVLTLSLHKFSPGFYPGTGCVNEVGTGNGKYYTVNVPFHESIGDDNYGRLFSSVFNKVFTSFKPKAMVVQCGADILAGDPVGQCNVTFSTMGKCIKKILDCDIPTLFLGGGGYNFPNTARYWTYLTSVILNKTLTNDIPDDSVFFTAYVPTYELEIKPGNVKDANTKEYIDTLIETVSSNCKHILEN